MPRVTDGLGEAAVEAVRALVGAESIQVEAAGVGASNAVFYVATASGHDLVARAARRPLARFEMERLVMGWASAQGVPVPTVYNLTTIRDIAVMVTDRLPGHRLADDDSPGYGRLAEQCGEILAVVHSIPTHRFGNLAADGTGMRATLDGWFLDDLAPVVERASSVCDRRARQTLDRIVARLERSRATLKDLPPQLAHGDFSPMNVLVQDGRVSGVVDWESAKSGPAALDFGWWDWFSTRHSTPFAVDEMLPGYCRRRDVDMDALTEQRQLVRLRITVGHVAWAADRDDPASIDEAIAALHTLIAWPLHARTR